MIIIMGSGSVGSLIGGLLSSKGHDVVLIGRESHITAIWKSGLFITGLMDLQTTPKAVSSITEAEKTIAENEVDYIFITTKAHQTRQAAEDITPLVSENTTLVSIQNGLGTEDVIKELYPNNTVLRCVTSIGVNRPTNGVIEFSGKGKELIGFSTDEDKVIAEKLVKLLKEIDFDAHLEENIKGAVFTKTIVNCALNPLTAIYNVKNGHIYNRLDLRGQAIVLATEAWNVAKAANIQLITEDPIQFTIDVILKTAENTNSMLSDINNKRKTEIGFLNGKIIELGEKFGVDVSHNKVIYEKVLELEENFK
ncbi:MAG: ketopantoate reductase family protein [Candidatus Heimdallarchaeota archaeon]